jgi:hypothetical protein
MSRVHGDAYAEDANFSHFDRSLKNLAEDGQTIGLAEKAGKSDMPVYEDFPNNSLTQTDTTSSTEGPDDNDDATGGVVDEYKKIVDESTSLATFALEAVPRYSKKTGDLVIQGSNNSIIVLGTSGARRKEDEDFTYSNSTNPSSRESGCVDIIAGRSFTAGRPTARRTSQESFINSRIFRETLKDPDRKGLTQNKSEGDPDFYDDASRIYVSMKCASDDEFSLSDSLPYSFERAGEVKEIDRLQSSAVVVKSDNVRIIARKDDTTGRVNGSIKIVKEGMSAEDAASVILLPSGLVQITGSKVILGKHASDGGADDGPEEDDNINKLQPYIKYKQLEDLLKAIMTDIRTFCDTLSTHTTPGYGAPSPQINQAASSLKSAMDSREGEIVNLKSKRIFGE